MMDPHPRAAIRDAVVAHLTAGRPEGVNIFAGSLREIDEEEDLPAVVVYLRGEAVGREGYPPGGQGVTERTLTLIIDVVRAAVERDEVDGGVDAELDAMCWAIEGAMEWMEIPGFATSKAYLKTTEIVQDNAGRRPFLMGRMTYEIPYRAPYRQEAGEGYRPRAFWGQAPKIGAAHEADYEEVGE